MASSQDTEITLGTAKLLGLFFGLVVTCAVFFALGYTLGRKSDSGSPAAAVAALPTANGTKPASSGAAPAAPMTFYKAVEQQSANPQLTPAAAVATTPAGAATQPSAGPAADSSSGTSSQDQTVTPPDPWPLSRVLVISCR